MESPSTASEKQLLTDLTVRMWTMPHDSALFWVVAVNKQLHSLFTFGHILTRTHIDRKQHAGSNQAKTASKDAKDLIKTGQQCFIVGRRLEFSLPALSS